MSNFKFEKPPVGLSSIGLYIFYKCQMEMYRKSLGFSIDEQPNKPFVIHILLSVILGIPVGYFIYRFIFL